MIYEATLFNPCGTPSRLFSAYIFRDQVPNGNKHAETQGGFELSSGRAYQTCRVAYPA